jgi:succinyl-CoA synthetase beta subunit
VTELGLPVVVKADGPAHKSASGGVALGIDSAQAAIAAVDRLGGRAVVAKQVPAGPEAICGMTRDPDYGPLVAAGLGGVAVEALSLAAVALAPLDLPAARATIARAPGLVAVAGEAALEELAQTLVALGRLAFDHPEIEAVDINPLILAPSGTTAVDALVVVSSNVAP